jgi:hypothetical protein
VDRNNAMAKGIGWGYYDDLCYLYYDKLENE